MERREKVGLSRVFSDRRGNARLKKGRGIDKYRYADNSSASKYGCEPIKLPASWLEPYENEYRNQAWVTLHHCYHAMSAALQSPLNPTHD